MSVSTEFGPQLCFIPFSVLAAAACAFGGDISPTCARWAADISEPWGDRGVEVNLWSQTWGLIALEMLGLNCIISKAKQDVDIHLFVLAGFGYGAPPPPPDQFAPPGVPPPPATPGAAPLAFPPPPPPSQATQDMSKPPTAQPEFPYSQFGE